MNEKLEIFNQIALERERQDKKWGQQNHNDEIWHLILAEEFGEISQNVCASHFDKVDAKEQQDNLDKEIIQAASVLVAWAECRKRKRK